MFQSVVCDLNCRRFDKSGSAQVQRRIGPFHPVSERGASATHWLWALFIPYQREGPQLLTGIGPFHPVSERGASANHSATHLALGAFNVHQSHRGRNLSSFVRTTEGSAVQFFPKNFERRQWILDYRELSLMRLKASAKWLVPPLPVAT